MLIEMGLVLRLQQMAEALLQEGLRLLEIMSVVMKQVYGVSKSLSM